MCRKMLFACKHLTLAVCVSYPSMADRALGCHLFAMPVTNCRDRMCLADVFYTPISPSKSTKKQWAHLLSSPERQQPSLMLKSIDWHVLELMTSAT